MYSIGMNKQKLRCEDTGAWNCKNVAVCRYKGMLRCKRHLTFQKRMEIEYPTTHKAQEVEYL